MLQAALSITVETDGSLPSGHSLMDAIQQIDGATGNYASYFQINCAHPSHFMHLFEGKPIQPWMRRILGIEANASKRSHAELDECEELDSGNPVNPSRSIIRILILITVILGGAGSRMCQA